ncbi:MAG: cupredoxin domain-containing protein [Thaumarchaeota archaeon]|nr:cupredoxin domain-containing protein [Nitrososphaerota archaeon]
MTQKTVYVLGALSVIALVISGAALMLTFSKTPVQPTERTFYLSAIEPKGTASVSKEPFPTQMLPAGGGYVLKEPDKDGNWVVETYVWQPAYLVAQQGDRVTLNILGVNGATHTTEIEGYDKQFVVKRGELTTVSFIADKAGTFRITCKTHSPSMEGALLVLPRG